MIRPIIPDDSAAIVTLTITSGLFPADEVGIVEQLITDYFAGNCDRGHVCVLDIETEPLGVAYYEPVRATDRTWELLMIGVRKDQQGMGRGSALLSYVEHALQADGQRLLLVETSGVPSFALTREFYVKCGYEAEARIRDYYAPGDDMILFRKMLNAV